MKRETASSSLATSNQQLFSELLRFRFLLFGDLVDRAAGEPDLGVVALVDLHFDAAVFGAEHRTEDPANGLNAVAAFELFEHVIALALGALLRAVQSAYVY